MTKTETNTRTATDNGTIKLLQPGDTLAQMMGDGTVKVGTVGDPVKVGRQKAMRPSIKWGQSIPLELVRAMAEGIDYQETKSD